MPQVIALAAAEFTAFVFSSAPVIGSSITAGSVTAAVAAGTAGAAITTVYTATELILYAGLILGAYALLPKPPQIHQQIPLRQAIPPKRSAYGLARLSGPYMLFEAYGHEAQDVIALAEAGPVGIDSFQRYFLNDDEVFIASDGHGEQYVQPRGDHKYYRGGKPKVYCDFRLGLPTETAYTAIFNSLPSGVWPTTCRGDGIASMAWRYVQDEQKYQSETFPNGCPQPSVAAKWLKVYDPRSMGTESQGSPDGWVWSNNPVLCLIDFLTSTNHGMGLPFEQFIQPNIASFIAAANVCDEQVQVAAFATYTVQAQVAGRNSLLLASVTGISAGVVLTVGYGSPDVETATVASIDGNKVTFTANLTHDHPQGDEIQFQANGQAFINRYTANGAFDFTTDPADVINEILGTFDGWLGQDGRGAFVCYAGKYYEPAGDEVFTDDHVVGYSLQHFLTDEEACNQLLPNYTDPNYAFNTVDAGEWDDLADQAIRGRLRSKTMNLPWVSTRSQARRLAKRQMSRFSQELRGTLTTTLYGANALGKRFWRVQVTENQSLHDLVIEIQRIEFDLANLQIKFTWVAADPNIDDWSISEETDSGGATITPATTRVASDLTIGGAPTINSGTIVNSAVGGGASASQVQLNVTSPTAGSDALSALDWVVQWAPHGTTNWQQVDLNSIDNSANPVLLNTGIVPQGGSVDIQAAYGSSGGLSDWSNTLTISVPTTPLAVGSGFGVASSSKSSSFTTTGSANCYYVDTSGGAVTVTLNATPGANEVVEIWDSTGHAAANPISLNGNGNTIAGAATVPNFIAINFGHARLIFDGSQWLMQ